MERIEITTEFITLGQFLKFSGIISNGGEAKSYLQKNSILVNNEPENRRGKKLRDGDFINLEGKSFEIFKKNEN